MCSRRRKGPSSSPYGPRMMSSSPETSTRTTGAHRAQREERDRGAARTPAQGPPARYEPYLDGLFTYCLSVLCDHDAAIAALGDVLTLAERRGGPLGLSAQAGRGQAETSGHPCGGTSRNLPEGRRTPGRRGPAGGAPPRTRPPGLAGGGRYDPRTARG